ncbi:MAG: metal-dependent transcriptional regulator, partial [Nanoarchaeota archaeon]|nr:metal-dependent transcriptional regulator [Nanoarchaeota archaeon]
MQISTEDYLRIMYSLFERAEEPEKGIRSSYIALSLGISKPSVSSMLKKFKEQRLVRCSPYSKIFFTKKGEKEAKRIMHNHRVIEVFLRKILRYDIRKVHEEANRLEHAFS